MPLIEAEVGLVRRRVRAGRSELLTGEAKSFEIVECNMQKRLPQLYSSRTSASNARPDPKNTTSTAMPAFWLAVIAVIVPISSGPTRGGDLSVSANNPKYWAMRSFGAMRISRVRDAAWSGPPAAPIKHPSTR